MPTSAEAFCRPICDTAARVKAAAAGSASAHFVALPRGRFEGKERESPISGAFREAGNGVRTRDPQLGKLMLYQLSYPRAVTLSLATGAPSSGSKTAGHPVHLPLTRHREHENTWRSSSACVPIRWVA